MKRVVLAAFVGVLLLQPGNARISAQGGSPLTFFKNYFITGDYVVGGASLWRKGVNGRATANIDVSGVPASVDILSAFLYVQTAEIVQWSGIDHAKFDGNDLGPGSNSAAKALNWDLATVPCWSVGTSGGRRMVTYRADVLRYFQVGSDGKLVANGNHTISVPDFGYAFPDSDEGSGEGGNGTGARAIGASLVIVYRDPTKPFKGIVIYDGGVTKPASATLTQQLQGFYQAAATATAKLTPIVGDGRSFLGEKVRLDGQVIATNPFASTEGAKWDSPTFENLAVAPNAASTTVQVSPNGVLPDCLCFSGMVFSTDVQDTDGDGLLDIWESSTTPILDPNGKPLPNLNAMGAHPDRKDLFVEIGYMKTDTDTSYGGVIRSAHSHLPTHAAIKLIGDAFANAPTGAIQLHVDLGDSYPSGEGDPYIIHGAGLARGGEAIDELATTCTRGAADPPWVCQFSDYPGTVGWKSGYRFLRDEVLSVTPPNGVPAPPPGDDFCDVPGYSCVRRFDQNRDQMFRYALFAHAVGLPKSELPCLDATGTPVADVNDSCAVAANPDFHVPRTNTGIGDFPGADVLVTLGGFDDNDGKPVGTPFMQASTWMHEFGHNFERRHGGGPLEPNCKPNYLSAMNYLYQLRGLLDDAGAPHLDYSREVINPAVDEGSLSDGSLSALPYRMGWFAPLAGSYLDGRGRAATKHCDGSPLLPTDVPMARIDARTAASPIDWNANGATSDTGLSLDVNFDGRIESAMAPLVGSDDWSNIELNQLGSRRNVGGLYVVPGTTTLAVGPLSADVGKGDLGKGDLGKGDLGKGDLGKGDLGKGDLGKGDLGKGDLGKGDLGKGDLGGGDLFLGDPNSPGGELDADTAAAWGIVPPNEFTACVIGIDCPESTPLHQVRLSWTAPTVGAVVLYSVYRVPGTELIPGQPWEAVGTIDPSTLPAGQTEFSLVDPKSLANGASYTYFSIATYVGGIQSDPSNVRTVVGVNDPPTGHADSYATDEDTPLVVPAVSGVLSNDTDDTSTSLTAALATQAAHGTVVFATDGSFTYTPAANYNGPDSFTYTANDGAADSAPATVSITVKPVNDPPTSAPDAYNASEDTTLVLAAPGVLANDSDIDVDSALTAVLVTGPSHGTLVLNANGSFSYTPAGNYNGADSFTYKANDGTANSAAALVSIDVGAVNDAPVASSQVVGTAEDTAKAIVLSATDVDSPSLTYIVVSAPGHGTLTGALPNVIYTPAPDYYGPDGFTFKANDGSLDSNIATVGITVSPVNDPPTISNIPDVTVNCGKSTGPLSFTIGDETPASVVATGSSSNTTLVPNANIVFGGSGANRTVTVTPSGSKSGTATITVKVTDSGGLTATDTFVVTVKTPVVYGVINKLNLPPSSGTTFKPSSTVTLKWQFAGPPDFDADDVLNSVDALPVVTFQGPYSCSASPSGAVLTFTYVLGNPAFVLPSKSNSYTWQFNWLTTTATGTPLAVGCYNVKITSLLSGQIFDRGKIQLK